MRLTAEQINIIKQQVLQVAGQHAHVRLFGSRLDDNSRGGDIDLMLELEDAVKEPAFLSATLAAKISIALQGRKVDVLLSAPNLQRLPIHEIAHKQGVLL